MEDLRVELPKVLATVTRGGAFASHGRVETPPPALTVDGVGRVALPLLPAQIPALVGVAERAPYGKGTQTLVDTDVRRTWQIGAAAVHLNGKRWPETIEGIARRAADGLGYTRPVTASLYKLLVYDEGSFFVDHRDTEKAPGMFATLVVVLPSDFEGGELVVRHGGQGKTFDLRTDDPGEVAFAAFYADCVHEVRPITRGCRLALIYNLVRTGKGALPTPPAYADETDALAECLFGWDDDGPDRLVLPLDHAYTPAELSPAALKGRDAAVAQVVFEAARAADCEAILSLVTLEEFGIAEYHGWGYGRRRGRGWDAGESDDDGDDDGDFSVYEVTEQRAFLEHGCDAEGRRLPRSRSVLDLEELCPPDVFENGEPDDLSFTEATGNEGASFERTYHRAALVVWQKRRSDAVIANEGPAVSVPHLEQLVAHGGDPRPLAVLIIERWASHPYHHEKTEGVFGVRLLALLCATDTLDVAERYLRRVTAVVGYIEAEVPHLLTVLGRLPVKRAEDVMTAVVSHQMASKPAETAALFARFVHALRGRAPEYTFRTAAFALAATLPGRAPQPVVSRWDTRAAVPPGLVTAVLDGLTAAGDEAALQTAVDHMIAARERFPLDGSLVPGVVGFRRATQGADPRPGLAVVAEVERHCIEHLQARIALSLAPPADETREAKLSCRCAHCTAASAFLAHPTQRVWELRAAKDYRAHVESTLRAARADVDCETVTNGNPHGLICRKTRASYERRVVQRKHDLAALAALGADSR